MRLTFDEKLDFAARQPKRKAPEKPTKGPPPPEKKEVSIHPKPFRVAQDRRLKGPELRQIDARTAREVPSVRPIAEEVPFVDSRPVFVSRPNRPKPKGDALAALEARLAAEQLRSLPPSDPSPPPPKDGGWSFTYRKPPSRFDLACQAAKDQKQRELLLADIDRREPFFAF